MMQRERCERQDAGQVLARTLAQQVARKIIKAVILVLLKKKLLVAGTILLAALLAISVCVAIATTIQQSTTVWPVPIAEQGDQPGVYPASGWQITSPFGWRRDPLDPTRMEFHDGIDLAGPTFCHRCPLPAMFDARVSYVGSNQARNAQLDQRRPWTQVAGGQMVVVDNGPNAQHQTLYAHLEPYRLHVQLEGRIVDPWARPEYAGDYAALGIGERQPDLSAAAITLDCQEQRADGRAGGWPAFVATRSGPGRFLFEYDRPVSCTTAVSWGQRGGGWQGWIMDEPAARPGSPQISELRWATPITPGAMAGDVALRFRAHLVPPPPPPTATPTSALTPTVVLPTPTAGSARPGHGHSGQAAQLAADAPGCISHARGHVRCSWRLADLPAAAGQHAFAESDRPAAAGQHAFAEPDPPPAATPDPATAPCYLAAMAALTRQGALYSQGGAMPGQDPIVPGSSPPRYYARTGPDSFDCSGLVWWAYAQAGIAIGRNTYEQQHDGVRISCTLADLHGAATTCWTLGDLLFLRYAGGQHVAIYVGGGMFMDCYSHRTGCILRDATSDYFTRAHFWHARRIVAGCEGLTHNPGQPIAEPVGIPLPDAGHACRSANPSFAQAVEELAGCGPPVRAGETIHQLEDTLGFVGMTGSTIGPHLHLGIRQRGSDGRWNGANICTANPQWLPEGMPTPTYHPNDWRCQTEYVDPQDFLPRAHAPGAAPAPSGRGDGTPTPLIAEGEPFQLPPPGQGLLFPTAASEPLTGQYWSPYADGGLFGGGTIAEWFCQTTGLCP